MKPYGERIGVWTRGWSRTFSTNGLGHAARMTAQRFRNLLRGFKKKGRRDGRDEIESELDDLETKS